MKRDVNRAGRQGVKQKTREDKQRRTGIDKRREGVNEGRMNKINQTDHV